MFQLSVTFIVGIAATLLAFSLRPPVPFRRVPAADRTLRTASLAAFTGAALLGVGFREGQRYMALPPADMRAVASSMERTAAANLVLERSVSDFSAEVDNLFRCQPMAPPIVVSTPPHQPRN